MTMMNNELDRSRRIDPSALAANDYLNSLLAEAFVMGLISQKELEGIQNSLLELLTVTCVRFTGGDSTSLRTETAEKLAQSCVMQISLLLKSCETPDDALELLLNERALTLYERGHFLCISLLNDTRRLLRTCVSKQNKYSTLQLKSTLTAMRKYLASFNADFFAAAQPPSPEYALWRDILPETLEDVHEYLFRLSIELGFCSRFAPSQVTALFDAVHDETANLYTLTVSNAVARLLCGLDLSELKLTELEKTKLSKIFCERQTDSLEFMLENAASELCILTGTAGEFEAYYRAGCHALAVRCGISASAAFVFETDNVHEHEERLIIRPNMGIADFKDMIGSLSATDGEEKAKLLLSSVHSIYDFIDALNSDAFEDDEIKYFSSILSEDELVAIISVCGVGGDDRCAKLISTMLDGKSDADLLLERAAHIKTEIYERKTPASGKDKEQR